MTDDDADSTSGRRLYLDTSAFHAAEKIDRFVTTDGAQHDAAQELGLPTASHRGKPFGGSAPQA